MAYVNGKKIPGSLYMSGSTRGDYDLVITSDEAFSPCLYPLFKNEESLTQKEAVEKVKSDPTALNSPSQNFTAKRILVKGVTFTQRRGYDDIRLHIFQPSIEYIKFENCRWETIWRVSGSRPTELKTIGTSGNVIENPTEFLRVKDASLVVDGLTITESNVNSASAYANSESDYRKWWGIGLRNVGAVINCSIQYPENYEPRVIESSDYIHTFNFTVQGFEYAEHCKMTSLWDGDCIEDCRVTTGIFRCSNISNVIASPVKIAGETVKPLLRSCDGLSNLLGDFTEEPGYPVCTRVDYDTCSAFNVKKAPYVAKHTENNITKGDFRLYAAISTDNGVSETSKTAREKAGGGYIPIRDSAGHIWIPESPQMDQAVSLREAKKRFPELSGGKIPSKYLPKVEAGASYCIIEGDMNPGMTDFYPTGEHSEDLNEYGAVIPRKGVLYLVVTDYVGLKGALFYWNGNAYVRLHCVPDAVGKYGFLMANGQEYDFANGVLLPEPPSLMYGSVMQVVNGDWEPVIFPIVTTADNGKVMQVIGGVWKAVSLSSADSSVIEGYYFEQGGNQYFSSHENITDAAYAPVRGKLYVDVNTNFIYRWDGSNYVRLVTA